VKATGLPSAGNPNMPLFLPLTRKRDATREPSALEKVSMVSHFSNDECGDVRGCDTNSSEGIKERCGVRVVPLVDHFVTYSDARVHQDCPVRMANEPSMNRKGLECAMLGVPLWHRVHGRQDQAVNLRQRRESHRQQPTGQGVPIRRTWVSPWGTSGL